MQTLPALASGRILPCVAQPSTCGHPAWPPWAKGGDYLPKTPLWQFYSFKRLPGPVMKSSQFSKALQRNIWGGREEKKKGKKFPKNPTNTNPNQVSHPKGQHPGFWGRCRAGGAPPGPGAALGRVGRAPRAPLAAGTKTRVGRKAVERLAGSPAEGRAPPGGAAPSRLLGGRQVGSGAAPLSPRGARQRRGRPRRDGTGTTTGKSWQGTTGEGDRVASPPGSAATAASRRRPRPPPPGAAPPRLAPLTRRLRRRRTPPAAGPGSGPALPRGFW